MSRFLSRPTIYPFEAANTGLWAWAIDMPLRFEVGPRGSGWIIEAEEGFCTDLGSIPPILRPFINPANPRCALPWILHDKLNELTRMAMRTGTAHPPWLDGFSSQFAAAMLYEALAIEGEPELSRIVQHHGVLLGIAKAER